MQRHKAITPGPLVLMRSFGPLPWPLCELHVSAALSNNTEKYFNNPMGEHNTLCCQWSGSVYFLILLKTNQSITTSPFFFLLLQTYMVRHGQPLMKYMLIKHFEGENECISVELPHGWSRTWKEQTIFFFFSQNEECDQVFSQCVGSALVVNLNIHWPPIFMLYTSIIGATPLRRLCRLPVGPPFCWTMSNCLLLHKS